MPRRNRLWHRKGANQPLPTPKTPLDQEASSKQGSSIGDFKSGPSPQGTSEDHRWSFSSHTSNQNSIYLAGGEKSAGTSQEQGPKGSVEASASSAESEMSLPAPMAHGQKSHKIRCKAKKKNKGNSDVGRPKNPTQVEDSSTKKSERSNGESFLGWSRTPSSTKLELKKGEWKKKISSSSNNHDPISQSMRNAPLSSNGDRQPIRKTRSLEAPFTRKPMRWAKFAKSVDVESTDPSPSELPARQKLVSLSRQPLNRSKSKRNSDSSKRDTSLDPSDLQKPARRANVNDSLVEGVDTLMNRSDTELSRIRSKIEKMKLSRKLDESNRSRKEVRSLDRMTVKQSKSARRMINHSSEDKVSTEEIKDNLGGSLPDLPLDSSLGQNKKKSKPKSTISMDLEGNQSGTDLSLESFPGRTKTKKAMRSKSADSWEEDSESDLAHILSSSRERFHKTKPLEADEGEHPDAMQMWSARLKTNKGIKPSENANVAPESPERRKPPRRSQSGRRSGLMKGSSLPNLSFDPPFESRKKTRKPRSRTSINVCSSQNERDLSLQSFGGRLRKQKPRSARSVDDSWMHSSENDLSLSMSEGLAAFDRVDELKESTDNQEGLEISQRSNSILKVMSGRGKSANRRNIYKENSSRILGRSSDHSQKDEEEPLTRTAPQKARSDGSLAKIRRWDVMGRKTPSRITSAQHLYASSNLSAVKIDFAGEMNESKNIFEVLDDISVVLEETEKLKRIMHLETVVHMLQETFQKLDSKMDDMDFDSPMRMQTRAQVLQAENEVLRTRIDQQDEALIKYKNQAAKTDTTVQNVAIDGESDKSAAELRKELEEMKTKLEEKDKIIEDQTSRCKEMETEMEEVQKHSLDAKEVPTLQKRIWELEKEKTAFMTEISRLHKSNFDISQSTLLGPESTTSVSSEQSGDEHNNQGPGLVGWLLGDLA